jgi:hypothetical protein
MFSCAAAAAKVQPVVALCVAGCIANRKFVLVFYAYDVQYVTMLNPAWRYFK